MKFSRFCRAAFATAALALSACDDVAVEEDDAPAARTTRAPTGSTDTDDWVVGNIVFMLYHEVGHALIAEFELPVLGREEDAVDQFATVLLAPTEEDPDEDATRNLLDAMDGWFRSSEQAALDDVAWWDEHGPDVQRAYNIACLVYGSDPEAFASVANDVELPEERRETCPDAFATASNGWWSLLEPHLLADDTEPTNRVRVIYDDAEGHEADIALLRDSGVLEAIAEDMTTSFDLPRDLTIRAGGCDEGNAYWDPDAGELQLCYELVSDFRALHTAETE